MGNANCCECAGTVEKNAESHNNLSSKSRSVTAGF